MRVAVQALIVVSFLLLGLIIYSNTFHSSFQFDDETHIEENAHIRLTQLSWEKLADVFKGPSKARPVPMFSLALNYYFGRYDVVGYHLVNILIHVVNATLLYLLLRATLRLSPAPLSNASWVAFFSALLWFVHPVQTQSVTYIVQRINSMAALFYVLSLLLYVRGRTLQRQKAKSQQRQKAAGRFQELCPPPYLCFASSVLSGLLAMASKEISFTLPFFVLLYEWYFFQDLSWPWLRRSLPWMLFACIPVAVLLVVHFGGHPLQPFTVWYGDWFFTMSQRVMTELRVVLHYVSLLFYPHPSRLNLDYDFPLSYSLFEPPTTLLSLCVIAGLTGLACWLAKRERLLSFCILWFFGNLVIESSIIPLDLVYEHRLYLPSMFVSLAFVAGLYRYVRPKRLATGLLLVAAVVLSLWTVQRNEVWRDPVSLWTDVVKKSPNCARPHNNLGEALVKEDKLDQAIPHFHRAFQIDPDYAFAYNNLGSVFAKQGNVEGAIVHYRRAIRVAPDYGDAHNNLGIALAEQGRREEAIVHYREALRITPNFEEAHNNLGIALAEQGHLQEAITQYREAIRIEPDYASPHYNLGLTLELLGERDQAIVHYQEAIRIDPDYADAHNNLGNAMAREGNFEKAIIHYQEALRIQPEFATAHNNLANIFFRQGRIEEAITHFRKALRIQPDFVDAQSNLGIALARQGEVKEAIVLFREALRIRPDFANAHFNLGNALFSQEKLEEAIVHYREALRIDPAFAGAHYNLGKALARQGNLEEAKVHYEEAMRIRSRFTNPGSKP